MHSLKCVEFALPAALNVQSQSIEEARVEGRMVSWMAL